jgi:dihydrofolate synthase/folylpolyglutamate synthase
MVFDPDPELAALLESLLHPQLKRISPGLERMEALLNALGNPHHTLPPVIHIAGTNGKGSTLAIMRAVLEAVGMKVHLYSSPHLIQFNERITVAGEPISKANLMPLLERIYALQSDYPATFFEATTAAAFLAFAEASADIVLLETGMGGRLDSTNVIDKPLANLITPIGFDHQDFLGDTLTKIAAEKAGILRTESPAFIAKQPDEGLEVILSHKADSHIAGRDWDYEILSDIRWIYKEGELEQSLPYPGLLGEHQIANAALAIACLRHCFPEITFCQIAEGIQKAAWPARIQPLTEGYWRKFIDDSQPLYLDGAHNPMAARRLVEWSSAAFSQRPSLVIAMKSDKDAEAFLKEWQGQVEQIIFTEIEEEPESAEPEKLLKSAEKLGFRVDAALSVEEALSALKEKTRPIIICGSLYLAGNILGKS